MRDDSPSRTAVRVALRRAAHQVLDRPPVFTDPLAVAIVGADPEEIERDRRHRSTFGRGMRAFLAVRSRWAEDRLAEAVAHGVSQYVLLGAGLDTFALRNPDPGLQVFEVDHPASQAFKRRRIEAAGLAARSGPIYVPVDFETQDLPSALAAAGFDAGRPAFFAWLGVVPYLEEPAILETLRFVAARRARPA